MITTNVNEFSIDLRSDTVTKPSAEMREVMISAITGDDVFAEDPEINELQEKCAKMFGMEAGLYCPSGTMTNQIAISVHTQKGDEVICDNLSHVYNYEGGGIARLSGASVKLMSGDRGRFTAADVLAAINPDDSHYANTSLVCLEDTCNKGAGSVWDISEIEKISKTAREKGLAIHLDGARLWNALVARGVHNDHAKCAEYAKNFDSISLCLSKGLGCPVGSVLIGSKEFIARSHRARKVFGGGMRQAGIVAAACVYALDNNLDRLAEDHKKARLLGEAALNHHDVESLTPIETNIVILNLKEGVDAAKLTQDWGELGIHCFPFSASSIRFVTHLDVTDEQVEIACQLLCAK
jgi:threonine aldolase